MPGHIIVTENQAISANRYRHAIEFLSDMEDLRWVVGNVSRYATFIRVVISGISICGFKTYMAEPCANDIYFDTRF